MSVANTLADLHATVRGASYAREGEYVYAWRAEGAVRLAPSHPASTLAALQPDQGAVPDLARRLCAECDGGMARVVDVDDLHYTAVLARGPVRHWSLGGILIGRPAALLIVALATAAGSEGVRARAVDAGLGAPCLGVRGAGWVAVLSPIVMRAGEVNGG